MFDYMVKYEVWVDDVKINRETIITLDDSWNEEECIETILKDEYINFNILEIIPMIDYEVNLENIAE